MFINIIISGVKVVPETKVLRLAIFSFIFCRHILATESCTRFVDSYLFYVRSSWKVCRVLADLIRSHFDYWKTSALFRRKVGGVPGSSLVRAKWKDQQFIPSVSFRPVGRYHFI